jgi:MFS family permease
VLASVGAQTRSGEALQLHRWHDRPLVGVALVMLLAGFAQFSPAAALADVAEHFGDLRDGDTIAEQAGLPGSVLGAGLAIIRLSALAALPLAALADRIGRRRTLLTWVTAGLLVTAAAAASPGYWWFVLAFAVARPLITATDTIGEVMAAEHTASTDRAKAIALASAAYGVGAGAVAVLRGALGDRLSFRGVFVIAGALLVLVAVARRLLEEPDRFRLREAATGPSRLMIVRGLTRRHRHRLVVVAGITFAAGWITGPSTTFLFVYAENVRGVSTAVTAALVVASGATGLAGLLIGRALSDRIGRRSTGGLALGLLAAAALGTYSGPVPAIVAGYPVAVLMGAVFGTPTIALANELFPTVVRAAVAGWLVVAGVLGATCGLLAAGAIADASESFTVAMAAVCVPGGLVAAAFALLPETRGVELEQSAGTLPAGFR